MMAHFVNIHAELLPRKHSHHDDGNPGVDSMELGSIGELEPGQPLSGRSAMHYEHVAWAQTLDQLRDSPVTIAIRHG
jgi:hypothetical protein